MNRIAIYPKDISILLGRSERYSRNLIIKIKKHHNKSEEQFVTIDEFCTLVGLNYTQVNDNINRRR